MDDYIASLDIYDHFYDENSPNDTDLDLVIDFKKLLNESFDFLPDFGKEY